MPSARELTVDQMRRLSQFDTPTICNVIELFDVRPSDAGHMDQRVSACFGQLPPMVGYASTATFRASKPQGDVKPAYQSLTQQIDSFAELPGPAVVVFEDLDQPTIAATFGEMMCRTYQAFGAVGLITSGAGRDMDQVRAIDFPCFVGSVNPSHGYCHIPTIGEPVTVGGLLVRQGDLLHGDCNGVTSIPHEIASEVADAAQRFVDAESVLTAYLNSDAPRTTKGYIEAVEELSRQVDQLRRDIHSGAKE